MAVSAHWGDAPGRRRLSRRDWGPTHGPRLSLLSAYQGIPAGLSYWTTMGEYSQASVLSEHWPGNSAIRCRLWHNDGMLHRVRGCQVWLPRAVHAQWAEVRTLHFFPGRGCTHSAHTPSLCSGSSTPGSALLPYGFGSAGRSRSCCYTDSVTG